MNHKQVLDISKQSWLTKLLISLSILALMFVTSAQAQNNNFAKYQNVNAGQLQLNHNLVGYTPDCYTYPNNCNPLPKNFCLVNPWACPQPVRPPIRWPDVCLSCPPDILLDKNILINEGLLDVRQQGLVQVNPVHQGIQQTGIQHVGQAAQVQGIQMLPGDQFKQFR